MAVKKKALSKKEWAKFCADNSQNSYTLVICLCIMHLWEKGVVTFEEAEKESSLYQYSLTGFQARSAIEYALHYDAEKIVDKTMAEISRGSVDQDTSVTNTSTAL